MGWWIALAVFLYFVCAALLVAEVFVPSGGVISVCAIAALVGGIWIFFRQSTTAGIVGICTAVVMIPAVLAGAYKVFPKTRFGKSIILSPPVRERGDAIADRERLSQLVGRTGKALTPLRPVGTVEFNGDRVECVAESGYVDKGARVKVIRVESTQVTVRVVEQG